MNSLDLLANDLSQKITAQVIGNVEAKLSEIMSSETVFCFTEEEAAAKLKISKPTLERERKDGSIDFSTYRGKIIYMPHHIYGYLLRHERKRGKQEVTLGDVLQFPSKAAA